MPQDVIKKVIRKKKLMTQDNWMYAKQECGIHEMVSNHENIVKLYDQQETDDEYQMYMEYCDKADSLTEKVREVSPCPSGEIKISYSLLNHVQIYDA